MANVLRSSSKCVVFVNVSRRHTLQSTVVDENMSFPRLEACAACCVCVRGDFQNTPDNLSAFNAMMQCSAKTMTGLRLLLVVYDAWYVRVHV